MESNAAVALDGDGAPALVGLFRSNSGSRFDEWAVSLCASGDMRALLLETLPLLLIPAGALDLHGRHTSVADWVLVMCLYAMARLFDLANSPVLEMTGSITGHTLMQLSTAALGAWIALRSAQRSSRSRQDVSSFGDSSQRRTSLYTSL